MDMCQELKNNMLLIADKLEFTDTSKETFIKTFDEILDNALWWEKITETYENYKIDIKTDIYDILLKIGAEYEAKCGNAYTFYLTVLLCFAEVLHQHYIDRGLAEEHFYNAVFDLRYKHDECVLVKGCVGTFVPDWFAGFFSIDRVALGRLQFELFDMPFDFILSGTEYKKGTKVINVHIPRTGTRLDHNDVEKSYKMAAEYFKDEFKDGPILFSCGSWMLFPWHKEVLSETSNMMQFYNDFEIVKWDYYADYSQIWRLFDCEYEGDPDKLPQDSSLRRAYVNRIKSGEKIGWGRGVFIYK